MNNMGQRSSHNWIGAHLSRSHLTQKFKSQINIFQIQQCKIRNISSHSMHEIGQLRFSNLSLDADESIQCRGQQCQTSKLLNHGPTCTILRVPKVYGFYNHIFIDCGMVTEAIKKFMKRCALVRGPRKIDRIVLKQSFLFNI